MSILWWSIWGIGSVLGVALTALFRRRKNGAKAYSNKKLKPKLLSNFGLPCSLLCIGNFRLIVLAGVPLRLEGDEVHGELDFELDGLSLTKIPSFYSLGLGRACLCHESERILMKIEIRDGVRFSLTNKFDDALDMELKISLSGGFKGFKRIDDYVRVRAEEGEFVCGIEGGSVKTGIKGGVQNFEFNVPVLIAGNKKIELFFVLKEAEHGTVGRKKETWNMTKNECLPKNRKAKKLIAPEFKNIAKTNEERDRKALINEHKKTHITKGKKAICAGRDGVRQATKAEIKEYVIKNFKVFVPNRFIIAPDFRYLNSKQSSLKKRHVLECIDKNNFAHTLPIKSEALSYKDMTNSFVNNGECFVCFLSSVHGCRFSISLSANGFSEYVSVLVKCGYAILTDMLYNFSVYIQSGTGVKGAKVVKHFGKLLLLLDLMGNSDFICVSLTPTSLSVSVQGLKQETFARKLESITKFSLVSKMLVLNKLAFVSGDFGLKDLIRCESEKVLLGESSRLKSLYTELFIDNLPFELRFRLVSGLIGEMLVCGREGIMRQRQFRECVVGCIASLHEVSIELAICFVAKVLPFIRSDSIAGQLLKFLLEHKGDFRLSSDFEYALTFLLGVRIRGDKLFFVPDERVGEFKLKLKVRDKHIEFASKKGGNMLLCNGIRLGNLDFINLNANAGDIKLERV